MSAAEMETLGAFARFVKRSIGLHFTKERLPELGQKMAKLAGEAWSADLDGYLLRLMSEPLSRDRLDMLVRALTIGETYFLRDPKSYRAFTDHLLPELIEARRETDRTIRIWSAGCSSGEEPYTIAILLSRIIPDLESWNITILATDINREALDRAESGLYRQWSFRNAPEWLMGYFDRQADGRYEIRPAIRKMVTFREMNLAAPDPVAGTDSPQAMDFIFCRNVMLYFGEREIERTMATFRGALRENGSLFIGPTEMSHTRADGFALEHHNGTFVLRRSDEEKAASHRLAFTPAPPFASRRSVAAGKQQAATPLATSPSPLSPSVGGVGGTAPAPFVGDQSGAPPAAAGSPSAQGRTGSGIAPASSTEAETAATGHGDPSELYRAGRYQQAAEAALALAAKGGGQAEALALGARAYANMGKLEEARLCCERAIACDRLSAANHYLLSIILEQQGEKAAAVQSLKHAIFIDHDYLVAYLALGNLNRQSGQRKEAERNFGNALRLLDKRHPDDVIDDAAGMTAGRLAQVVREGLKR